MARKNIKEAYGTRIIEFLTERPFNQSTVKGIKEHFNNNTNTIDQVLSDLYHSGKVAKRRVGLQTVYSLTK